MENRIAYEKYGPDDFAAYYELVQSDRVMRYITGKGLSEASARTTFKWFLNINQLDDRLGYFKVTDTQTGIRIGECKLVHYGKGKQVFEVGYLLQEQFWGMGYGTLICEAMLSLASAIDPSKPVVGVIDPDNVASRRLLEKFGFVRFFTGEEEGKATEKLIRRA